MSDHEETQQAVAALEQTLTDTEAERDRYGDLLPRLARRLGLARLSDQNNAGTAARRLTTWLEATAPDTDARVPGSTDVIVRGRQRGKTAVLARWLLEGHTLIGGDWSRRLITADAQRASFVRDEITRQYRGNPNVSAATRADRADHLRACVLHAEQAPRVLIGIDQRVEVAVDDAVDVLARVLRVTHPIAVVAINGQEWRP